ncbi:hypothetical protein IMG5_153440 [Ichthyophthirius multifiliis]|uniref:Uncharacterized protein n=1 Tax=Ichthyophthirius multifiliis TaxID=5932 RepID=G0QZ01_ICHMU|nr:hypothetical protein IMG5_153440 [Ichthyophthirius multifiliis]EGR29572.1 hypothetical protein IMG5_153440 [Ichthyophthirius multifiliis]|eukprot:XP_004030808.1 hypothetical protein IMG5_153440 [Ichthyophthirius multifiliis]
MSSTFIWGMCAGFIVKTVSNKVAYVMFCSRPWEYPKMMLYGGILASCFDYGRRWGLEQICINEEKLEQICKRQELQALKVGEELKESQREMFMEYTVKMNNI